MKKIAIFGILTALLAGCSSSGDKADQLELLAVNRVRLISSELPTDKGPLSIMRASSHKNVIEIMMIYNSDADGALPLRTFAHSSTESFCKDKDIQKNLEVGLVYRIKVRNPRGQLMIDQMIDPKTCKADPKFHKTPVKK